MTKARVGVAREAADKLAEQAKKALELTFGELSRNDAGEHLTCFYHSSKKATSKEENEEILPLCGFMWFPFYLPTHRKVAISSLFPVRRPT